VGCQSQGWPVTTTRKEVSAIQADTKNTYIYICTSNSSLSKRSQVRECSSRFPVQALSSRVAIAFGAGNIDSIRDRASMKSTRILRGILGQFRGCFCAFENNRRTEDEGIETSRAAYLGIRAICRETERAMPLGYFT